ncbi:MAG: hypothetical protein V3T55_07480, partial [Anaerolineales bacterium]
MMHLLKTPSLKTKGFPLLFANEHLKHNPGRTSTFVGLRSSKCGGTLGNVESLLVGEIIVHIQHLLHVE